MTASTHINLGIDEPDELLRAYRVLRLEAALFLALTAASPFLAGKPTGRHSSRWLRFPLTPERVPFFPDAATFAVWMDGQLESGTMQNQRHLWLGIRPNGPATPRVLDRLELRICDRISDPHVLRGGHRALRGPGLAGAGTARSRSTARPVLAGARGAGRRQRARRGHAEPRRRSAMNWVDGRSLTFRDWVRRLLDDVADTADRHGLAALLAPIEGVLTQGNPAIQWLRRVDQGATPQQVIQEAIVELAALDRAFDPSCPLVA